jgi:hypothetical protein
VSIWGPDRDRDADDAAQADRAEQVGFRPYSTGGGGGSTSSSSCLVTVLVWLGVAAMMAGSFLLFGGWTS